MKPFVRVCSSLPGEPPLVLSFLAVRSHCWQIVGHPEGGHAYTD